MARKSKSKIPAPTETISKSSPSEKFSSSEKTTTSTDPKELYNQEVIDTIAEKILMRPDLANKIKDVASGVAAEKQVEIIAALGIFVALITFVSINVQIFSRITSLNSALVFVVLMFVCLSGFSFLLHALLTDKKERLIVFLLFIVFALGFVAVQIWGPQTPLSKGESSMSAFEQRVSDLEKTVDVLLQVKD